MGFTHLWRGAHMAFYECLRVVCLGMSMERRAGDADWREGVRCLRLFSHQMADLLRRRTFAGRATPLRRKQEPGPHCDVAATGMMWCVWSVCGERAVCSLRSGGLRAASQRAERVRSEVWPWDGGVDVDGMLCLCVTV